MHRISLLNLDLGSITCRGVLLEKLLALSMTQFLGTKSERHQVVLSHFSHGRLFAILWAVTYQAPLSMGFSRQEYWSGLPCPPSGNLPDLGMEPTSLKSPALEGRFFSTSTTWEGRGSSQASSYII